MKKYGFIIPLSLFFCLIITLVLFSPEHGKEKRKESEILEALQSLSKSRAFPNVEVPYDAYSKAYEYYRSNFLTSSKNIPGSWQNIGPNNVGGRTISIAIPKSDTSIVWLGSASGGLWKSTTGGIGPNAWTYIETGFPVLGVSSIVIDPTDSDIIYIGTGETYNYGKAFNGIAVRTTRGSHGIGILKSTDGGLTWTQSLNWNYNQLTTVWDLVMNPKNPSIVYAGTTEGIYKSTNAGSSWNKVSNLLMAMDLEIDKQDTNIVYAGIGNFSTAGNGLYKTINSGNNWIKLTNGLPVSSSGRVVVSMYEANNKILMAMFSNVYNTIGVYRSLDEGLSWTLVNNTTEINDYQGWYCKGLLMNAADSSKVLAGGVYLYTSNDNGSNFWSIGFNSVHPDFHDIISNPLDPSKVYMITDGGLYRSNDFGQTIYDCNDGYVTSQFYIGSVSAYDKNVALGGMQDNSTYFYNGTNYWYFVLGGDGCFNAIHPFNNNIMYASYQGLQMFKSTNQGFNFVSTYAHQGPAPFVAPFVMCQSDPDVLYAGAEGLIKTTDAGNNWTPVGPAKLYFGSDVLSIGVSHTSTDTLYCGMEPYTSVNMKILRSVDGGNTFTDVTGPLPNRYPRDIEVNPNNSKEVYVVFSGFGTGHVYKTTDAGATWSNISANLPDVPFHSIALDPFNEGMIYAGSDYGVFSSSDGGQSWHAFATGMPLVAMVFDLVVSKSDTTLMAYTHGNGVYKRGIKNINVGLKKERFESVSFEIFPNPSEDDVVIRFENKIPVDKIELVSLSGKVIRSFEQFHFYSDKLSINVRDISGGTYLLKIRSGENSFSKKLIVR